MGDEEGPRCIVSDPAQPHNLSRRAGYKIKHECFACGENSVVDENRMVEEYRMFEEAGLLKSSSFVKALERSRFHYYCTKCDVEFHSDCIEFPSKMIHPYHPQHPLTFTFLNYETGVMADTKYGAFYNFMRFSDLDMSEYLKTIGISPKSNIMFDVCTWCGNHLGEWFYSCSVCNFSLDFHCATNIPPLTIQNPKSHHHSLALFPRPLSSPCDACGLINVLEPSYACCQCSYVVHKTCIDLPRVIKITRHPHRLSHSPFLPAKVSSCRVCYKNVDIKYGQYSCNHGDCTYVVHSKCATHEKTWDGTELEWETEESNETEDFAPFKNVGDNLIEHFFHHHHYLRLERYEGVRDSKKQCHACIRPIRACHDFYNCIKCDFFLHEVCANLPRKLNHALHKHPLFIDTDSEWDMYKELSCSACTRFSSGFKYKCREWRCTGPSGSGPFQLDINCILVPECFTHKSHEEHLVFISTSYSDEDELTCQGCKESISGDHLHCTLCEFAICYKCATIPNEIYYKFDENPLSLRYGETGVGDVWWCEVCEKRLDPTEWFYTNSESCTTIHHHCLFTDSAYMKSGHIFSSAEVEVVSNGSSSRPICSMCHQYCPDHVYFKVPDKERSNVRSVAYTSVCSLLCLTSIPSWKHPWLPPPPPPLPSFSRASSTSSPPSPTSSTSSSSTSPLRSLCSLSPPPPPLPLNLLPTYDSIMREASFNLG